MNRTLTTPIALSLERANARFGPLGARFGDAPDGWLRASDVVSSPEAVRDLLDQVQTLYGMDENERQIAASFLVLGYFWYPMVGALACYLLDRRVPDLSTDAVATHVRDGVVFTSPRCFALPDDPDADHPDVTVMADRDELRACLIRKFDEHATPLFATLRSVAPYGFNGMRTNYVDRLASAVLWLCEQIGDMDLARDEVPACVALVNSKSRAGIIEIEHDGRSGVFLKRSGCCLSYRLPGNEMCDTCSLRSMDDRVEVLRKHLRYR